MLALADAPDPPFDDDEAADLVPQAIGSVSRKRFIAIIGPKTKVSFAGCFLKSEQLRLAKGRNVSRVGHGETRLDEAMRKIQGMQSF